MKPTETTERLTPEAGIAKVLDLHRFLGYASETARNAHMCSCGHFGSHQEHLAAVIVGIPGFAVAPTALLSEFRDDEPCSFDHHGGCQTHGHLDIEPGELCPMVQLRQTIDHEATS